MDWIGKSIGMGGKGGGVGRSLGIESFPSDESIASRADYDVEGLMQRNELLVVGGTPFNFIRILVDSQNSQKSGAEPHFLILFLF